MIAYWNRIERLDRLVRALPARGRAEDCLDPAVLLERLASSYSGLKSPESRKRAIQRDLDELVNAGRIEIANPGGKPQRYRRQQDEREANPYMLDFARKSLRSLIQDSLPTRRFDGIWRHLLDADNGLGLGEDKLRVLSDTQRLLPADISETVLADVLEALALSRALIVSYRDAKGKRTRPVLHPQALVQRGPRIYLHALKDDESEPVRTYALHRITKSEVSSDASRQSPQFDLGTAIDGGYADFASGQQIVLEIRARGYVAELLRDCPLSEDQRIDDEVEASRFEVRVSATVPASGQLFRWLLGFGDKIEVVAPQDLRNAVASQSAKVAAIYK